MVRYRWSIKTITFSVTVFEILSLKDVGGPDLGLGHLHKCVFQTHDDVDVKPLGFLPPVNI